MDGYLNRWFLDPVFRGRYPEDMVALFERRYGPLDAVQAGDRALMSAPIDFLGVNYYMPKRVKASFGNGPLGFEDVNGGSPQTAMGWEVDADGLHALLLRVRRDYGDIPIYITENGAAYDDSEVVNGTVDDPERTAYLEDHLAAIARAVDDGVDVQRYYAWSLLDNFEWEHGYDKRFGIVRVDYETQTPDPEAQRALVPRLHRAGAQRGVSVRAWNSTSGGSRPRTRCGRSSTGRSSSSRSAG